MNPTNDPLSRFLANCLADSAVGLEVITGWWEQQRTSGETLEAFLCRQGILKPDCSRTLDLIARGYLSASCKASILTEKGLERLQEVIAALRGEAEPAEVATATTKTRPMRSSGLPKAPAATMRPAGLDSTAREAQLTGIAPRPAPTRSATWPPARGTMLGKYLLTEQIGRGTSGVVYRAINQVLNLSVAVKVLHLPDDARAEAALMTLASEARMLASLNHPNVVRLWDFEADPAMPFMVVEYVEGLSLAELIAQCGRLALERAIDLICQAGEGLNAVWELGIVHRDVKPHNILITRDGRPKIVDLGLALMLDGSSDEAKSELAGTAAYMAPEQGLLSGEPIDFRADMYSLGATLYHALTGQLPYRGATARELMLQHAGERPVPPHLVVPGLNEQVSDVVLTMMERDPDDRYQSAQEMLTAMRSLREVVPPEPSAGSGTSLPAVRPSGFWKRLFVGGERS